MHRRLIGTVLGFAPLLIALPHAAPAYAATPAQVEASIQRAKKSIYAQRQVDGTWEKSKAPTRSNDNGADGSQWGGVTALCTYALLAAGDNPQSKELSPAVAFLKKAKLSGTYALGLRCQVWLLLPETPEVKALMKKDAGALRAMMKTEGRALGFYDYDATDGKTTYSLSRSQYAVLGMWAAAQMGVETPRAYWQTVETAWIDHQDKSGGWNYQRGGRKEYPLTPGMTAAGVATLYITQEYLTADAGRNCKGNIASPAIDRGLKWMAQHFDQVATDQRYPRDFPYATLYGVERVGVASGRKYFGDIDWFARGADFLLREQRKDGSWSAGGGFIGRLPDTCFGLLFLARGRAPLVMSKLEYTADTATRGAAGTRAAKTAAGRAGDDAVDWNQRPRDAANLSRWIGRQLERDLNWQIVSPDAPAADLQEAPILYVSGTKDLRLDEAARAKLRAYVEQGGLILGNADCGGRAFAAGFRRLGKNLFPQYAFRELPPKHPIYEGIYPREKWRQKPSVLGLSNGVRELMLLIPQADPARTWQSQMVGGKEEFWQLGADIFLYVADSQDLRYRGDSHLVARDPKVKPTRQAAVARLQYNGNWDPEPGGWRRLADVLCNADKTDLLVRPTKIARDALLPAGDKGTAPRVAHLTGTAAFKLDEPARTALRQFIKAGGTLVIDAAGGSPAFATAAEAEVKAIFPDGKLELLPPDHAVYGAGGKNLDAVAYRPFARKKLVGLNKSPRLKGITQGGRVALFFSREDLSAGMVGQPVGGILGYDPATATEIMRRVVLYACGTKGEGIRSADTPKPKA